MGEWINGKKIIRAHGITVEDYIHTVPWTDYSPLSTIVGWSSFTIKKIMYTKLGKLVFVCFELDGVSNSTTTTFTLRYSKDGNGHIETSLTCFDNNAYDQHAGFYQLLDNGNTIICYRAQAAAWTASGRKFIRGEFFYYTP